MGVPQRWELRQELLGTRGLRQRVAVSGRLRPLVGVHAADCERVTRGGLLPAEQSSNGSSGARAEDDAAPRAAVYIGGSLVRRWCFLELIASSR